VQQNLALNQETLSVADTTESESTETESETQTARRFDGMIPLVGALTNQDLRRTYKLLWF